MGHAFAMHLPLLSSFGLQLPPWTWNYATTHHVVACYSVGGQTNGHVIISPASSSVCFIASLIAQDQLGGWDEAWQENVTPWDAGQSQPPLRDLLTSDLVALPRSGRALVPGCGRGYDAILIASSLGLDTTGLDISAAAVAAANAYAESSQLSERTKVKFEVRNFFALSPSPDERYDLIYDYTFFVAINPARRPEWGRQMSSLVKPGGFLIILVWPIVDRPEGVGPPFFVRPEHYTLALGDGWDKILDQAPQNSVEAHKDKERLLVFRRL